LQDLTVIDISMIHNHIKRGLAYFLSSVDFCLDKLALSKGPETEDLDLKHTQQITSCQSVAPGMKSTQRVSYFKHHSLAHYQFLMTFNTYHLL